MRSISRKSISVVPLLAGAALFTLAGGYVHIREWFDVYRQVPASEAGSALVRIGFPVNAGVSVVLASALLYCAFRRTRLSQYVVAATALFQAGSLAILIGTRTGTVFGWSEPIWTLGASQSRAVEIGALVSLAAVFASTVLQGRRAASPGFDAGSPWLARTSVATG